MSRSPLSLVIAVLATALLAAPAALSAPTVDDFPESPSPELRTADRKYLGGPMTLFDLLNYPNFDEFYERSFETILADTQLANYTSLSDAGRTRYRTRFWRRNDPTAATERNEFLEEHLSRVSYALWNFSSSDGPVWDDRGEVVIRFGVPSSRARVAGDIMTSFGSMGIQPNAEYWMYHGMDMQIEFIEPNVDGTYILGRDSKYVLAWGPSTRPPGLQVKPAGDVIEAYGPFQPPPVPRNIEGEHLAYRNKRTIDEGLQALDDVPVSYGYAPPIAPITVFYEAVTAKGPGGTTDLAVNFQVPMSDLGFREDGGGVTATLRKTVRVMTERFDVITLESRTVDVSCEDRDATLEAPLLTDEWRLEAEPGEYVVGICVEDTLTGRSGYGRSRIVVPDYDTASLALSDIQIATSVGRGNRFLRMGNMVVPQPMRAFEQDEEMYIYFEVYGLEEWDPGRGRFTVKAEVSGRGYDEDESWFSRVASKIFPERRCAVSTSVVAYGDTPDTAYWMILSLESLIEDNYDLTITVRDHASEQVATKSATFTVLEP
jgi:GWxTD domain-containing protein